MTKLDVLLQRIDPDGLDMREMAAGTDAKLNSFHVKWAQVQNREEFRECIAAFIFHAKIPSIARPWFASTPQFHWWGIGRDLLELAYGPNGTERAFRLVAEGADGGTHGVLRKLSAAMLQDRRSGYIAECVRNFWESLTVAERLNAPEEYMAKWGDILPLSLRDRRTSPVRARFTEILKKHPDWLRQLRSGLRPAR